MVVDEWPADATLQSIDSGKTCNDPSLTLSLSLSCSHFQLNSK